MTRDAQKYFVFIVSVLLLGSNLDHEDVALDASDLVLRIEPMTEHLFNIKNYRIAKNAQNPNPTQNHSFPYQLAQLTVGSAMLMLSPQ